jgi:hypothetical protein
MPVCVNVCACKNLQGLVEETGSSPTVKEVVELLHVALRELLREVEAVQHNH